MSSRVRKPRRKPDGSYEIPVSCTVCGANKCEVNSVSGKVHCWSCSAGSRVPVSAIPGYGGFLSAKDGPGPLPSLSPAGAAPASSDTDLEQQLELTDKLPVFALQECERRRQEPQWLIQRYRVRWSYSAHRLWFPAGDGGVLRSVLSWEDPKTKCITGPSGLKGLIGKHLLDVDREEEKTPLRLVLVEGDWKAVSIPVPWVGIGLQGTQLTQAQRFKILSCAPTSIVVMLDGGWHREAQMIVEQLLPYKASRVILPGEAGPDDVPRAELVRLLLSVEGRRT